MAVNGIAWGILGTGRIAQTFARRLARLEDRQARGRRQPHAAAAAEPSPASSACRAATAATRRCWPTRRWRPSTSRCPTTCTPLDRALRRGRQAHPLREAAGHQLRRGDDRHRGRPRHDVFLMEAFMYRCHPQTAKLVELVRRGRHRRGAADPGPLQLQHARPALDNIRQQNAAAGGGIMDVGCYCAVDGAPDRRRRHRPGLCRPRHRQDGYQRR